MCNLHAMFRIHFVTRSFTCYTRYLMGTKVICMIAHAGEGLAWVRGCSMCTRTYVHRLYSMKDKARQ